MREHSIFFSGPEVHSILDGTKMQARRVVRPQPEPEVPHGGGTHWVHDLRNDGLHVPVGTVGHLSVAQKMGILCPYGQPGDRLWVRETWALENLADEGDRLIWKEDRAARWRSDDTVFWLDAEYRPERWRSPVSMPRWASRLTLEITHVGLLRLQEITAEDMRDEGFPGYPTCNSDRFKRAWDATNKRAPWASNPWVWALTFRRVVDHG